MTKLRGEDLKEFALVGEGSWCKEFGETEMGTLMELTLIFLGLCVCFQFVGTTDIFCDTKMPSSPIRMNVVLL